MDLNLSLCVISLLYILQTSMHVHTSIAISFRNILQSGHYIIWERSNKVADVFKSRDNVLSDWADFLRDLVSWFDVFRKIRLTNFFEMIAELCDSANDLINLVFHFTLRNSHSINKHSVINLLLSDSFIVFLQVFMLNVSAVRGTFQSFYFVFPALSGLIFLLNFLFHEFKLILKFFDDGLSTISLIL